MRHLIRTKFSAVLLILLAPNIHAQAAPPEVAKAVMRAEQQWNDAWLTRDLAKVKAIIADDYVGADDDGVFVTKADHVDNFAHPGGEVFKVLRVHDMHVRVYGDIAVNVGELHMELTHDGLPTGGDFLFTDVWRLRNGVWQVVASAETPTKAQQKNDKGKPKVVGPEAFKPAAEVFRALPKTAPEVERQIVEAEHAIDAAYVRKDYASIRNIIAADLTDVWDDGFISGVTHDIEAIKSGESTNKFINPISYVVQQHGDIAVWLATVHQAGMYQGHHFDENLNTLDVWHREAGAWKLIASHSVLTARQPPKRGRSHHE